jgi:hypothetical protein
LQAPPAILGVVDQVRREGDAELCGHVERRGRRWFALTVFGAPLGDHDRREDLVDQVLADGLPSLAAERSRGPSYGRRVASGDRRFVVGGGHQRSGEGRAAWIVDGVRTTLRARPP